LAGPAVVFLRAAQALEQRQWPALLAVHAEAAHARQPHDLAADMAQIMASQ
jgi:hypothetical protein